MSDELILNIWWAGSLIFIAAAPFLFQLLRKFYLIGTELIQLKSHVNCWFCNCDHVVTIDMKNSWNCPNCGSYNGFNEAGDYNRDIPEMRKEHAKQLMPKPNKPGSSDGNFDNNNKRTLCETCNTFQLLKIQSLAAYEAPNDRLDEYRAKSRQLDEKYPLCASCQLLVETTLAQQQRALKTRLFNQSLTVSKNHLIQPVTNAWTNLNVPPFKLFPVLLWCFGFCIEAILTFYHILALLGYGKQTVCKKDGICPGLMNWLTDLPIIYCNCAGVLSIFVILSFTALLLRWSYTPRRNFFFLMAQFSYLILELMFLSRDHQEKKDVLLLENLGHFVIFNLFALSLYISLRRADYYPNIQVRVITPSKFHPSEKFQPKSAQPPVKQSNSAHSSMNLSKIKALSLDDEDAEIELPASSFASASSFSSAQTSFQPSRFGNHPVSRNIRQQPNFDSGLDDSFISSFGSGLSNNRSAPPSRSSSFSGLQQNPFLNAQSGNQNPFQNGNQFYQKRQVEQARVAYQKAHYPSFVDSMRKVQMESMLPVNNGLNPSIINGLTPRPTLGLESSLSQFSLRDDDDDTRKPSSSWWNSLF